MLLYKSFTSDLQEKYNKTARVVEDEGRGDSLPSVIGILYCRWLAADLHDKIISQGAGGHRVYVEIRHPRKMRPFISFTSLNYDISEQKLKHIIGNLENQSPFIVEAAVTDNR